MFGIMNESHFKFCRKILMTSTFFEYFDLMLYVHMAYILNDLFFDPTNQFMKDYGTAIAFCTTFCIKPFGGYILGYFGDKYGRKTILLFCTSLSAICCWTTTLLPPYEQISIWASVSITLIRMLQGLASLGESASAEIYMAENLDPPHRYYNTALMGYAGVIGMFFAILVAKLVFLFHIDWRWVFVIGGGIVAISYFYRKEMSESLEFKTASEQLKNLYNIDHKTETGIMKIYQFQMQDMLKKAPSKVRILYFCVFCGWPVCFYFSYIYCASILKQNFGFSKEMIINQNFWLAIINLIGLYIWVHLTKYIHPLKILKAKLYFYVPFLIIVPFLLNWSTSPYHILAVQGLGIVMGNSVIPAKGVFQMYFYTLERFKLVAFLGSASHAAVYILTSFGLSYFTQIFGNYGVYCITFFTTSLFTYGLLGFIKLEKANKNYDLKFKPNSKMKFIHDEIDNLKNT